MRSIAFLLIAACIGLLSAAPADAQYYHSGTVVKNYAPTSYSYYGAGYYGNRWYPAGNYGAYNGGWYLQGYGPCTGFAAPQHCYQAESYYPDPTAQLVKQLLLRQQLNQLLYGNPAPGSQPTNPAPPARMAPADDKAEIAALREEIAALRKALSASK